MSIDKATGNDHCAKCTRCNEFVSLNALTPAGLHGTILPEVELIGIQGGPIEMANGKRCRAQIYNIETETLTYIGLEEKARTGPVCDCET